MTRQPILPNSHLGAKRPGSAKSEAKPSVTSVSTSPAAQGPGLPTPTPPSRADPHPCWFSEPKLPQEEGAVQKQPPETPTCRAVGAYSADRKEDVSVTV